MILQNQQQLPENRRSVQLRSTTSPREPPLLDDTGLTFDSNAIISNHKHNKPMPDFRASSDHTIPPPIPPPQALHKSIQDYHPELPRSNDDSIYYVSTPPTSPKPAINF
jgi:hypothetical protein